jgi:uncharacterized membrane protein YeaQ/YmgE (transglycosylase-associated protein family)
MGIIAFIILGALAGLIAKALLPGDDPGGFIVTTIIGIIGAILGGFLAAALFDAHPLDEFFDISTWLTAIVGSIILLVIYRAVTSRGGRGAHLGPWRREPSEAPSALTPPCRPGFRTFRLERG